MASTSRRQFLQFAAGSVGAAAALSVFPPAVRTALAMPAISRTGTIEDVDHVVIFMQENRSFDHYFGGMRGVRGFSDPRPVLLPNGKSVWHQPAASTRTPGYHSRGLPDTAEEVLPFYLNPKQTTEYQAGTNHGWSSGHLAWNNGRYDQWVNQKQDVLTMGYLNRQDISYHYALAEAFTLCDSYFCSVHADTAPNRIYLWTGTCDPRNRLGRKPNGPGLEERNGKNGYTWTTYPERLEAKGVSWKVYQGGTGIPGDPTDNYTDNSLEFFERYQVAEGAKGPLVDKGASQHTLAEFRKDAESGKLPQVSWIVSPYKYSEHPSASPTDGAYYINTILEALTSNPEVWGRTAFFVNYDENDGLFDHVVPPMPPLTSARNSHGMVSRDLVASLGDEILDLDKYPGEKGPLIPGADPGGLQPIGLGPRVPMLVISPWTRGGWVCSEVFDHTSVLRFLETRFDIAEPNISAWRRSVCGDLTSAFDFSGRADTTPVKFEVPKPITSAGKPYTVPMPQTMPAQEPGTRRARPLPYQFVVNGHSDYDNGRYWLDFSNTGEAGAAFFVYDRSPQKSEPRRYTVSAGDDLSDFWRTDAYQLAVYGPNGYLSEFEGMVSDEVDLEAEISPRRNGNVTLRITNQGEKTYSVEVSNSYSKGSRKTYRIRPGQSVDETWHLGSSSGWYDLSVTTPASGRFRRRFAGHVETGKPSTSDPAG